MKPKLYVETTVVGYLTRRVSRNVITAGHQAITQSWWTKRRGLFDLYCSELVIREASAGEPGQAKERLSFLVGIPILEFSTEAFRLGKALMKRKALPRKAEDDAAHLAIAAVGAMDFLLTWNCAHLANASLRPYIERICKKAGYRCPIICTPEELLEGVDVEDEIMTEMRRIKEEFSSQFKNLDEMFRYLKQCERESGRKYVKLVKKPKRRRMPKKLATR